MNLTDSEDDQQISIEERRAARKAARRALSSRRLGGAAGAGAGGEDQQQSDDGDDPGRLSPSHSSSRGRELSPPVMGRSRSDASPMRRGRSRGDLSPTRSNRSSRDLSPTRPSRSQSPIRRGRSARGLGGGGGFGGGGDTSPSRPNRTISKTHTQGTAPTVNVLDHSFSVTTSRMNLMASDTSNPLKSSTASHFASAGLDMSIEIIQGRGLAACDTDIFGRDTSSDPYVIASVLVVDEENDDNNTKKETEILIGQTKHISATLTPKWDYKLTKEFPAGTFTNSNNTYTLQLKLMDYDLFGDDDCMGIVKIPMKVDTLSKSAEWYDIPRDSAEKASGQIQLSVDTKINYSMDAFLNKWQNMGTEQTETPSAINNAPASPKAASSPEAEKPNESNGSGSGAQSTDHGSGKKSNNPLSKFKKVATATIASNKVLGKGANVAGKVTGKVIGVGSKVAHTAVGAGTKVAHTAGKVAHKTTDVASSAAGFVIGKDNVHAVTEAANSAASAIYNATNDFVDDLYDATNDLVDATGNLLVGGPSEDEDDYENIYKEEECFEFKLTVHKGDDLVAKDANFIGKMVSSDPYVVVEVWPKGIPMDGKAPKTEPIEFGRSITIPKTLKPVWNHTFDTFYLPIKQLDMEEAQFRVRIYDDDFGLGSDDKMGHVDVFLQPKKHLDIKEKWYHVSVTSASRAKGRIQLSWQTNQLMHNRVVGRKKIPKKIVKEPSPTTVKSTPQQDAVSARLRRQREEGEEEQGESSHQKEDFFAQQEDEMAASMPARYLAEEEADPGVPAAESAFLSADRGQSLQSIKEKRRTGRSGSVPTDKDRRNRRRRSHNHKDGAAAAADGGGERPTRPSSSSNLKRLGGGADKEADGEVKKKPSSSRTPRVSGEKSKKSRPHRRTTSSANRDEAAKKGSRRAASQPPKGVTEGSRQRRAQSVEPTARQRKPSSKRTKEKEESRRAASKRDVGEDGAAEGEKKRVSKSGRPSRRVTSKNKEMDGSAGSTSSRQHDDAVPKEDSNVPEGEGGGGEERKRSSRSSRHMDGSSSRHHHKRKGDMDGSSRHHTTRKSDIDGSSSRHHTRKSGCIDGSGHDDKAIRKKSSRGESHTRKSGGIDASCHEDNKAVRKKLSRGESSRTGKKGTAAEGGSSRKSASARGKPSSRSSRPSGTHSTSTSPKRVSEGVSQESSRRGTENSEFFADCQQLQKAFLDAQKGKSKLQQTMNDTDDIFSLGHRVSTAASTSFPDTVH